MIFTDPIHNIRIDLIDITICELEMISDDSKQLEGINRLLTACLRRAPLDGGNPLNFSNELFSNKSYILIQGNLINAIQTLNGIERISDNLRDDFIEQIISKSIALALDIVPVEKQLLFASKVKAAADLPTSSYSPTTFTTK